MSTTTVALFPDHDQAQDTAKLEQVWQGIDAKSCPLHYNFHMHTVCSDGQLTPEFLIAQATQIGLKGLAITDHHDIRGFYRAKAWIEEKRQSKPNLKLPRLWTGTEITCYLNETKVHILGYGFNPDNEKLGRYFTGDSPEGEKADAKQVINAIHHAEGLVVLAHPARYRRSAEELIVEAYELGIDGVETYYAYDNPYPWRASISQTERVKTMAEKFNLYKTCGTDTHGNNLLVKC